jgi:hypothetical protein
MQTKKDSKFVRAVLVILLVEKIIQHLFTAIAFIYDIPGIGTPDIGTRFEISNPVMATNNAVLVLLFGAAIWGIARDRRWAIILVFLLATFDIVAEFLFHGFFFITFSVIVSLVLIIVLMRYRSEKSN